MLRPGQGRAGETPLIPAIVFLREPRTLLPFRLNAIALREPEHIVRCRRFSGEGAIELVGGRSGRRSGLPRLGRGTAGISLDRRITYYKYRDRSHMSSVTGQVTNGWADPPAFAIHTIWPWDNHEVVHVMTALIGRQPDFFNEVLPWRCPSICRAIDWIRCGRVRPFTPGQRTFAPTASFHNSPAWWRPTPSSNPGRQCRRRKERNATLIRPVSETTRRAEDYSARRPVLRKKSRCDGRSGADRVLAFALQRRAAHSPRQALGTAGGKK